jgi:Uma2 family endonuclease
MVAQGIIQEDEPVELLEGWLVPKMTKNPNHWLCSTLVRDALLSLSIPGYYVHAQDPIRTSDSVPEPDVALVRGKPRDYRGGYPEPEHLALVIEVADSSLGRDRTTKKRIYARAKVPVYWIVNLPQRVVEVYTQPSAHAKSPTFKQTAQFGAEDEVPVIVDGEEVSKLKVKDLLP